MRETLPDSTPPSPINTLCHENGRFFLEHSVVVVKDLLSKIAPACASPLERFSKQRTLPKSSMRHQAPSLETGTGCPGQSDFIFAHGQWGCLCWPSLLIVMKKSVVDKEFAARAVGNPRLEIATRGTPGCYSADIKCRCAFSRARCEPPAPGPAMKLVGPLAGGSPGLRLGLRFGLRFALALEIERHCSADEILQGRLIDLVAFVDVDGAPDIPVEAGVE